MASSHIISIEDCGSGVYTKVRKQLNKSLGGPEFWDYDKPMFTVDCASEDFDKLQDKLGVIDGIKFLPDHEIITEVAPSEEEEEEEEEEEAPAPPAPVAASPALVPAETKAENDEERKAAMQAAVQSSNWAEYLRLKNSDK